MNLELISFPICPFVQRSAIVLGHQGIPFKRTYIDLDDRPDWFVKISPLGKVPLLKVDNEVLFESAVINEYINDMSDGKLLPDEPLQKARYRAWIEYASDLIMSVYGLALASTEEDMNDKQQIVVSKLVRLEDVFGEGPYFSGDDFSLVDASIAPVFTSLNILDRYLPKSILQDLPKLQQWSKQLLEDPVVKNSVPEDFEQRYLAYFKQLESYLMINS